MPRRCRNFYRKALFPTKVKKDFNFRIHGVYLTKVTIIKYLYPGRRFFHAAAPEIQGKTVMAHSAAAKVREMLIRFLPFFLKNFHLSAENPQTGWYGINTCDSWMIQSNLNIAGALLALAEEPELPGSSLSHDELRSYALKIFRNVLQTHKVGGKNGPEGKCWGNTWISVLGLERMAHTFDILRKYLNDEEKELFDRLCHSEADFLLADTFPVLAGIDAFERKNKPESNIWNGSFLFRTALDFPSHPNASAWKNKATRFLLNGISIPGDRISRELFAGMPLSTWHTGPNFTENFSLDHHGYLNVGYMVICLSNMAYLEFLYRSRGIPAPPETYFHARDLWNVLRNFIAPDGRLLRIGGDTRSRYTYCQVYLLPALDFVINVLKDPEAETLLTNLLEMMASEQQDNPDGGFYSSRLAPMRQTSNFYYSRIESDPPAVLAYLLTSKRYAAPLSPVRALPPRPERFEWSDDFHRAAVIRTQESFRSFVHRANSGMCALCVPPESSDMAEWTGNMTGNFGFREKGEKLSTAIRRFDGGFITDTRGMVWENKPYGEGETPHPILNIRFTTAALPDGRSMICRERAFLLRDYSFGGTWKAMRFFIPNDRFNSFKRVYITGEKEFLLEGKAEADEIIETASGQLVCDGKLTWTALSPHTFKIFRSRKQNVLLNCGLSSLTADTITLAYSGPTEILPAGSVLFDTAWAVSVSGVPLQIVPGTTMSGSALPEVRAADHSVYKLLWPEDGGEAVLLKDGKEIKK